MSTGNITAKIYVFDRDLFDRDDGKLLVRDISKSEHTSTIRLGGCNRSKVTHCPHCTVDFDPYKSLWSTYEDILDAIDVNTALCITGGELGLQAKNLYKFLDRLLNEGFSKDILLETNGDFDLTEIMRRSGLIRAVIVTKDPATTSKWFASPDISYRVTVFRHSREGNLVRIRLGRG